MDISINEHNGYFSLDMGYYNDYGFNNSNLEDYRFSLVFIEGNSGYFILDKNKFSFDSHVLICVNEFENLYIPDDYYVQAILFHPRIISSSLNFNNIRDSLDTLSLTEKQDCFYLQPFIKRINSSYGILFHNIDLTNRIRELFKVFSQQIILQDNDFWACRSRTYLIELLSLACIMAEEKSLLLEKQRKEKDHEILKVITYLKSNMQEKITISNLTKEFNLNRNDLSKNFADYTGETIIEFLNKSRIEMASTLLRDTKIPLIEIMETVGFHDYSYFSNSFKKIKGISPKNYRKKYCWMP
ncbi:helix-turn-helix domain-containing protein [Clostridium sp. HCS.1]|uniref:helix-turn-helix domain-containing protein n=1 Tax=Clostridium sp. HCS.1 TaxID=3238594 RepID=UPI003A0FC7E9